MRGWHVPSTQFASCTHSCPTSQADAHVGLAREERRIHKGDTLFGIFLFRGIGKGSDCRGEVNCEIVREDGLCGTTPDKPVDGRPRHLRTAP
jgi:hypothetical protein